jgi:hypothetical protein
MRIIAFARLAALAAVAALASAGGAAAQEGMFMKDLLGSMGIIPKERPPINYRERAPLVLPPKVELPPPAEAGAVMAAHPQWPNDPDVVAARRAAADARAPITENEKRRSLGQNPTLSIHEIRAGRRAGAEIPNAPVETRLGNARDALLVSPNELRAKSKDDAVFSSLDEPDRQSLTEPPSGFRRPTMQVKRDFEIQHRTDDADPKAYWREQAQRR